MACEATAPGRNEHRLEFDALVAGAMDAFQRELDAEYTSLRGSSGGLELLALPATELLGNTAQNTLSQFSDAVIGHITWLKPQSIKRAYYALKALGALKDADELCELFQSGRHQCFTGVHRTHFQNPNVFCGILEGGHPRCRSIQGPHFFIGRGPTSNVGRCLIVHVTIA